VAWESCLGELRTLRQQNLFLTQQNATATRLTGNLQKMIDD
jgi:hypothetical protein